MGEFENIRLFTEVYRLILPETHPLTKLDSVPFKHLDQEKMIIHKSPCNIRKAFRQQCMEHGIEPTIFLELEFNDPITSFVSKGLGLSVLPEMVAANIHQPSIAVRPFDDASYGRSVDLVSAKKLPAQVLSLFQNE